MGLINQKFQNLAFQKERDKIFLLLNIQLHWHHKKL
uniref:Uncharacterized protein n=1 Tax=Arundo donax TaxID=35708 RepID=A0A0A9BM51_ARUDO